MSGDHLTNAAYLAQLAALKQIFRPSSPTDDPELFRGRTAQLGRAISAVQELGQHVVVYGERGVGKTSLAYMVRDLFLDQARESSVAVRVPCGADDDFASVWRKFLPRLHKELDLLPAQAQDALEETRRRVEDILELEPSSPEAAARALHLLSSRIRVLVVLDEFDRIGGWDNTKPFADMLKTLSDDLVGCTVVVVGVADDVDGLIQGHQSIERAVRQVAMPRMSRPELESIVIQGFEAFRERSGSSLQITEEAVAAIANLSQGFPYYTHLLAGSIGERALESRATQIAKQDVFEALLAATEDANQAIKVSYTDAVTSARSDAKFAETLLGCALAPMDQLGYFAPADVAAPLSGIVGQRRSTPDYLNHLKRFASTPLWILETRGEGRKTRYRFANPLMKPFVLMTGIRTGLLEMPGSDELG